MIDGDAVVHEARYAHPVERVWRALTDPAELSAWLMPNDFAAVAGRVFRLDARPTKPIFDCEVVEVDEPRLLRCRWTVAGRPTMVTFWLEPDGDGTLLRLRHDGMTPETDAGGFDEGWGTKMRHDLVLVLDGTRDGGEARVGPIGLIVHPALRGG